MFAAFVLFHHILCNQRLQRAVHRGLRQADGLRDLGYAGALRLGIGQNANDGKSALQTTHTGPNFCVVRWNHLNIMMDVIPSNGINNKNMSFDGIPC